MARNIALVVGSLRKDSFTRKVATTIAELAAPALSFTWIDIGELPLFNQDLEQAPPKERVAMRAAVKPTDGVLFATPEYNRSVPGVLKNAIDVGSRPYGQSVWAGKPGAVVSVSTGAFGGFGANHHLRQSLAYLDVPCLPHETYVGNAGKLFDERSALTDDKTRERLRKFVAAFTSWVEHFVNEL